MSELRTVCRFCGGLLRNAVEFPFDYCGACDDEGLGDLLDGSPWKGKTQEVQDQDTERICREEHERLGLPPPR